MPRSHGLVDAADYVTSFPGGPLAGQSIHKDSTCPTPRKQKQLYPALRPICLGRRPWSRGRRAGSDELNERLLERVNAAGRVYMSHTRLLDRYVLRLAIGNADTNDADVRLAWDELNVFAEELEQELG